MMAALSPTTLAQRIPSLDALVARAATPLLWMIIGAEILALATWGPDTLRVWLDPATHGDGDFNVFYDNARTFSFNALYSPGLTVIMHPLTYLDIETAFRVYFGVNVAALLGVAWIAQGGVRSPLAKAAVVFGVLALPQTHWALRVGHFTEVLALAALGGLLLAERRPKTAGMLIAVLALKPQYIIVPLAYLLWTRNWRAAATCVGTLVALGLAGIVALALREPNGAGMVGYTTHYYLERVPWTLEYLTFGQQSQLYPQAWQYSWYGFLVSAGLEPNPLLAIDLLLLSAAGMVVVWWKCPAPVAKVATALGMLLLAPHSSFYNWSMLAVAGALLLRADIRPRYAVPVMLVTMFAAAAATQAATPWPLPVDIYRTAFTRGLYWVQPATLLALFALAVLGRRQEEDGCSYTPPVRYVRGRRPLLGTLLHRKRFDGLLRTSWGLRAPVSGRPQAEKPARRSARGEPSGMPAGAPALRLCARASAAGVMVVAGFLVAAYVSASGPFASDPYFNRATVLEALPDDFPLPDGSSIRDAGAGTVYPYRIEWSTEARMSEVAGIMRTRLADGSWRIVDATEDGDGVELRSTRESAGAASIVARVQVEPSGKGSRIRVEFSPIPATLVPGYDEWLESIGVVVHNFEPGTLPERKR